MLISIFTPTYNRSHLLKDLYESLKNQTSKDFEWLIIDDGSTDNTSEVVNNFINQNCLKIQYIKVKNGGKHRTINLAADYCTGDYIFIVDNDDTLIPTAIEIGKNYISKLSEDCAGVVFRLMYKDGRLVGKKLPFYEKICSYLDIRYKYGYNVDFKEFTKVEILKNYKYPEYDGENFCSEALVWNRISDKYKFIFVDEPIYVCEYLEGGLSSNIIQNRRRSSSYAMDIYKDLSIRFNVPYHIRLKSFLNYWRFGFFNSKSFLEKWKYINYSIIGFIIFPFSLLLILIDEYKLKLRK